MLVVVVRVGFGLELLGLVIAVWGYRRTWRDLRTIEGFFEPCLATLRRAWVAVLRRFGRRQVVSLSARSSTATSSRASLYVSPGRLPDAEADLKAFGAAVQHQLDALVRRTHETDVRQSQRLDAVRADVTALGHRLTERIDQNERVATSRTVRGLREQVAGWFFIAVGLVMQSPALF